MGSSLCPDRKSVHKELVLAGAITKKWDEVSFNHRIAAFRRSPIMPIEAVFPKIHDSSRLRRRVLKALR